MTEHHDLWLSIRRTTSILSLLFLLTLALAPAAAAQAAPSSDVLPSTDDGTVTTQDGEEEEEDIEEWESDILKSVQSPGSWGLLLELLVDVLGGVAPVR